MSSSALREMELMDNMQTIYKIMLETNPDNEKVQKELGKLTNNKDTHMSSWLSQTKIQGPAI